MLYLPAIKEILLTEDLDDMGEKIGYKKGRFCNQY